MMTEQMNVRILAPERPLLSVKASHLKVPGSLGEMGILPEHAHLISELKFGELTVEGGDVSGVEKYFVSGGYVEVTKEQVTVLVDVIERAEEIDLSRAQAAEKRAQKRIDDQSPEEPIDLPRALESLARAKARQKLASH